MRSEHEFNGPAFAHRGQFRGYGLVLAIGIVVDDAIVVVEAVQLNIDRGMAPREATIHARALGGGWQQ